MSDFAQYEAARHLGEAFAETVPGMQLLAVRDLDEDGGETLLVAQTTRVNSLDDSGKLVVTPTRKEFELTATFDELTAALGGEAARKTLFARWTSDVATEAPVEDDAPKSLFGHKAKK